MTGTAGGARVALFALLCAAIGLRVALFATSVTHIPPSSDECITMLQAKAIAGSRDSVVGRARQEPSGVWRKFPLLFMAQPYLFPLESYIAAPFVHALPRNAFGARCIAAIMGLASVVLSLLVLRRMGDWKSVWPGAILILFPSAYLALHQVAFALPGYPSFLLLLPLSVLLAQARPNGLRRQILTAGAAGFCTGLACAGSFLAAGLLLSVGAALAMSGDRRRSLVQAPAYAAGVLAGLIPFFTARWLYPDAFHEVTSLRALHEILLRFWSPALRAALPRALGIPCTPFPDLKETVGLGVDFAPQAGIAWSVLIVVALAVCATRFVARWRRDRWPSLGVHDIALLVSLCAFGAFVVSRRANSGDYRYWLPAVWSLPFLLAFLYAQAARWKSLRVVLAGLCILLALLNIANAAALMRTWAGANYAARELRLRDVAPVLEALRQRSIDRCYASYWDAYRIAYASDERVLCSQPYNERFFGWPTPYKGAVDASTNVAFVLAPGNNMTPTAFEHDLIEMGVPARRQACGEFTVYTDFLGADAEVEPGVESRLPRFSASHATTVAAVLGDGRSTTVWRSLEPQQPGMWIDIHLVSTQEVEAVRLYYTHCPGRWAGAVDVLAMVEGRQQRLLSNVKLELDRFEYLNGHPTYGEKCQTLRFAPVRTSDLRIRLATVNSKADVPLPEWAVAEIKVLLRTADDM